MTWTLSDQINRETVSLFYKGFNYLSNVLKIVVSAK